MTEGLPQPGGNSTLKAIVERIARLGILPRSRVVAMASTNPLEMLGLRGS